MMTGELTFLHGAATPRYGYTIDKHFNRYWALQYMQRGAVRLAYGAEEHLLEGAWFWPTYPGPRIRFGPHRLGGWWNHRYIAFAGPLVQQWQADGLWTGTPVPAREPESMAERFDRLLALSQRQDHIGQRRAINLLEGILLELAEERQAPEPRQAWLQEVLEALTPGPTPTPGVEALAHRCGMAVSTLRRRFKQAMGMSISSYALSLRVSEACRLLAESSLPIGRIADQLGYNDIYFFSRQFRQRTGQTPTTYRNNHR